MEINYTLILIASIVQFILGAVWYSPIMFGKWWMQIMEMTHLGKDEMKKLQKEMGPFYALQFLLTVMTTVAFAGLLPYLEAFSVYHVALWMWLGFIAPIQIASVVWGNTKRKFWCKQLFVMLSFQLTSILLIAWIVTM